MINKISFLIITLMFLSGISFPQNNNHKMSDTQKAQAAKADVYILNSKKTIKDTTTARRDTTAIKPKRNHVKPNKKSS